jgi:hypothetical protein
MSRHKALYDYLLEKGNDWTPQAKVARDLCGYFGNGEAFFDPKGYHNTTERTALTLTIREINESENFEKIIIASGRGIKLATEEEFDRYIKSQYNSAMRRVVRVYKMAKKGNRDGQINFDGHTIDAFLEKFPETT